MKALALIALTIALGACNPVAEQRVNVYNFQAGRHGTIVAKDGDILVFDVKTCGNWLDCLWAQPHRFIVAVKRTEVRDASGKVIETRLEYEPIDESSTGSLLSTFAGPAASLVGTLQPTLPITPTY